jgi:hypothetical protein
MPSLQGKTSSDQRAFATPAEINRNGRPRSFGTGGRLQPGTDGRIRLNPQRTTMGRNPAEWHDEAFDEVDRLIAEGQSQEAAMAAVSPAYARRYSIAPDSFKRMYLKHRQYQIAWRAIEAAEADDMVEFNRAARELSERRAKVRPRKPRAP